MPKRPGGLIAATFTPFAPDGQLALDVIDRHAELLLQDGVDGVFVCGSTGEGVSLTVDERMRVAQRWVDVSQGRLKVMVHVGHNCQDDACRLAEHASSVNASATSCVAPCYFRPADNDHLVEFLAPIAAAGDLPFYYYHIPTLTGVDLPMVAFLQQAGQEIPRLRGMKYTHLDFIDFRRCLELDNGRFEMFWGRDEYLLATVAMTGADAAVGTSYNYAAPLYLQMIQAYRAGRLDRARELSGTVFELIDVLLSMGGIAAGKTMLAMRGIDYGPVRSPLTNLSSGQRQQIACRTSELGMLPTS